MPWHWMESKNYQSYSWALREDELRDPFWEEYAQSQGFEPYEPLWRDPIAEAALKALAFASLAREQWPETIASLRNAARAARAGPGLRRLAFHGVLLGAISGFGVVGVDFLSIQNSLAAPAVVGEVQSGSHMMAEADLFLPPNLKLIRSAAAETAQAKSGSSPQAQQPAKQSSQVIHHQHKHDHYYHCTEQQDKPKCPVAKPQRPKHHTTKPTRKYKAIKPKREVLETITITGGPPPLPPPPPQIIVVPPPVIMMPPLPIDPCMTGPCAPECGPSSKLDIKGPCADPNTPCVQKVSFNEKGEATRVVLEPRAIEKAPASLDAERARASHLAGWRNVARETLRMASANQDMDKVALIMPFVNRVA